MSNVSFAYNIDDESTPCTCDDCGHVCPISDVEDITDVQERLEPGCIVPAGACPKCGALSYITPEPTITTREAALVVALNELIGAATWAYDDASDAGQTHAPTQAPDFGIEFDSCKALREARDKALATVAELFPEENKR